MNDQTLPLDYLTTGPDQGEEVAEPVLANPVDIPTVVDDDDEPASLPGTLPSVPRPAAVRKLAEQLTAFGMSEGAAASVARAVTRPEEARRRLQNPDVLRVPGGELDTIDIQVWTPAVSTLRQAETVEGPTGPYVRDFGWPTEDAEALGNRLTKLSARLAVWGQMYAVVGDPGDSDAGQARQQEDR